MSIRRSSNRWPVLNSNQPRITRHCNIGRNTIAVPNHVKAHGYSGKAPDNLHDGAVEVTRLKMDTLSPDELEAYLASGQWEGKAGAFGYQDRLGWIHILKGSPSNVVGLPLERFEQMLADFPA